MNITVTARHFRAPNELQQYAEESIQGLTQFYDGIVSANVVLEQHPTSNALKQAEIILSVYREQLIARENSDDFMKSITACIDKLERQLAKYKAKLHDGQHPHPRPEINTEEI